MANREQHEDISFVANTCCQYEQWGILSCDFGTACWLFA